jgi:hypothetical protein
MKHATHAERLIVSDWPDLALCDGECGAIFTRADAVELFEGGWRGCEGCAEDAIDQFNAAAWEDLEWGEMRDIVERSS